MAEEKQVQPETTEIKGTKWYVYYQSDPHGTTRSDRFHVITTPVPYDTIPWHTHAEKPPEKLTNPVWSDEVNFWVEDTLTGQDGQLAKISDAVEKLQESHEQAVEQTEQASQMMEQVQAQQMNSAKMMGQFSAGMLQMQQMLKNINDKLGAPTETKPADTKEEGNK
ncbi:hypothetical protein [Lactobacillus hominis]|uniref:Uncharacterized protein n=1 Tax=Lactobacillus hominis DSM 23910 = CRBIP 24.179 TaxID=1423758 RepID=I7KH18_9LACO|nr:hypothetical protein [Lactobacillus hominis]MCT3347219.1 hypothetical protein [Lactobacillus hominis]CCI81745.1 Putative uncharacterized protein orf56 [Lactobacillus hominis DSM 23910 = CRBIP 24.179]